MPSAVLTLTEMTFDEEVRVSPVPVIVEFWAQWCPPCKVMAPMLDSLATDLEGRLRVGKINVDETRTWPPATTSSAFPHSSSSPRANSVER